jgi:WD40 repeat protein
VGRRPHPPGSASCPASSPPPANGSPEAFGALALSPDGHTLAVAGDSGSLQLWDTAGQQPLGSGLTTPGEGITSLVFTPDAATLYATSAHIPLQHYPVNPSYAATWICAHTGTTLSPAQWHTYLLPRRVPGERLSAGPCDGPPLEQGG